MGNEFLCAVVNLGAASHVIKIAKKSGVKQAAVSIGHGSGDHHTRLSDILGLSDERKEIIDMVVEKDVAAEVIKNLREDMKMDKPHHGIAFTIPLCESDTNENNDNSTEVKGKMHKIINVIVDKGMAEEVLDAAKEAGARGGTIVGARGGDFNEIQKLFSVEIEPEKEKVFIIVKSELKTAVVEAINNRLNLNGQSGIVYAMTIDEVYGLHE